MKMVCAALQAPLALWRKPSANQRANQAQTNAQIIFSRTSVIFEMRRKPFCQLRKPFSQVAHIILAGCANHFGLPRKPFCLDGHPARQRPTRLAVAAMMPGHPARQRPTRLAVAAMMPGSPRPPTADPSGYRGNDAGVTPPANSKCPPWEEFRETTLAWVFY
jgi:hypothetical protein